MYRQTYFTIVIVIMLSFSSVIISAQEDTSSERQVITPENISQLESAFFLPDCFEFSPNNQYISGNSHVYDLADGTIHVSIDPRGRGPWEYIHFSPDSLMLAINQDGLYTTETLERHFSITHEWTGRIAFSPDSQLIAGAGDGVYDIIKGEKLFTIGSDQGGFLGTDIVFSPDGSLLVIEGDAVYDVRDRWRLFEINGNGKFSPDGNWLFIRGGELFDTRTWQKPFSTGSGGGHDATFSPDSLWLAVSDDGVYELASGEHNFAFGVHPAVFSPDSRLLAVRNTGVYSVGDWEKLMTLRSTPLFNQDGSLLVVYGDGVYETQTWEKILDFTTFFPDQPDDIFFSPDNTYLAAHYVNHCILYKLPGDVNVQQQFGVVSPYSPINIRKNPSSSGAIIASTELTLAVVAQNTDGSWYKVDFSGQVGWVAASVVKVIFLPDDLPVEEP